VIQTIALAAAVLMAAPGAGALETIGFETRPGPFCGKCTTIKLTVQSDGTAEMVTGWWAGDYRDWRTSTKRWTVTREQFAAYRDRLAPYRPQGALDLTDSPPCKVFSPDSGGFQLRWTGGGADSALNYDVGCDEPIHRHMRAAIESAPKLLGIEPVPR
jgi:hypothetical protein